jgi:small-conductance mechanosensitive channel
VTRTPSPHAWIVATAYVVAGLLAAVVLRVVLRRLGGHAERTRSQADDLALSLLCWVLPCGVVIAGAWAAVLGFPLASGWRHDADHALLAAVVLAVTFGVAKTASEVVRSGALSHSGTSGSATIFVNITRVAVLAIGLLILLDSLGVAIAPLLTALGVGGLAVALALQDTLTNLFAGVHILASRKVQPGDFIRLDNGMEGYIVDTNWRNTIVRQLPDNLVIVPNAKLAGSVLTNYHRPEREMSVLVQVGVSYDSDLEHVERVTCEVGREVMRAVEGSVAGHEPFIRYHTFADSSINFSVILRAAEAPAQYLIIHEFIKRLHGRYRDEGIEIPFPIRTIVPARHPELAFQAAGDPPGRQMRRTRVRP